MRCAKSLAVQNKVVLHSIALIQILCQLIFIHTLVSTWRREKNEFYSLFQRELSYQHFGEANMLSFDAPASSLLQQWISGKEQDSGRTTF